MLLRMTAFGLLALMTWTGPAVAGIILTIDNAAIGAGGTGTLDVRVTGAPLNTDLLDFFVGVFRITTVGPAVTGGVQFDDPQITAFDLNPNYVFFANTFGLTRNVTPSSDPQDTLTIIDGTANFLGVDVNAMNFLLATLEYSVDPGLVGITQYQVSLVAAESQFQTESFDSIAFSSSGGLITVTGSLAAVPEPGTVGLLAVASVVVVCVRRRPRLGQTT